MQRPITFVPVGRSTDEVGLALHRHRGRLALAQIGEGADAAQRIGERHQRAAMQDRGQGAKVVAHLHLGLEEIGLGAGERDAEQLGERHHHVVQLVEVLRHPSTLCPTLRRLRD